MVRCFVPASPRSRIWWSAAPRRPAHVHPERRQRAARAQPGPGVHRRRPGGERAAGVADADQCAITEEQTTPVYVERDRGRPGGARGGRVAPLGPRNPVTRPDAAVNDRSSTGHGPPVPLSQAHCLDHRSLLARCVSKDSFMVRNCRPSPRPPAVDSEVRAVTYLHPAIKAARARRNVHKPSTQLGAGDPKSDRCSLRESRHPDPVRTTDEAWG